MAGEIRLATGVDDGDTTAIEIPRFGHIGESHLRTLYVSGTFDSATVKFQISIDNSSFFDVTGADAITAKTAVNVEFRAKWVRISVSGSTTLAVIDAWLI